MFKIGLLTSTAMTAVGLLLSGSALGAQTGMHTASRDPNTRFLCTYGQLLVSTYASAGSSYFYSGWQNVAVAVTGQGQKVRRIRVIEAQGNHSVSASVSAGIYSNTPSGLPGKLIAGGHARVGLTCGPVKIAIPPTKLKRNTKYWVEETVQRRHSSYSSASRDWEAGPKTKRKAYVQYHRYKFNSEHSSQNSSFTSPWTEQSSGPYLKLK